MFYFSNEFYHFDFCICTSSFVSECFSTEALYENESATNDTNDIIIRSFYNNKI